jgi:hypothetical protein
MEEEVVSQTGNSNGFRQADLVKLGLEESQAARAKARRRLATARFRATGDRGRSALALAKIT